MEATEDLHDVSGRAIDQHVRKAMQERSPGVPAKKLVLQRIVRNPISQVLDPGDEAVSGAKRARLVPIHSVPELGLGERRKDDTACHLVLSRNPSSISSKVLPWAASSSAGAGRRSSSSI